MYCLLNPSKSYACCYTTVQSLKQVTSWSSTFLDTRSIKPRVVTVRKVSEVSTPCSNHSELSCKLLGEDFLYLPVQQRLLARDLFEQPCANFGTRTTCSFCSCPFWPKTVIFGEGQMFRSGLRPFVGVVCKKGPQKWSFQTILRRSMWCKFFF